VKDRYPAYVVFSPYGEMLPNPKSYVDLDPHEKDAYGLPKARRFLSWGENDSRIYEDMQQWSVAILKAAGAQIHRVYTEPMPNHELGGARMGADPKTSVVNADCRTHDIPNLYVVDGSVFPSASEKNPTHTIMALAARTADNIGDRLSRKEM